MCSTHTTTETTPKTLPRVTPKCRVGGMHHALSQEDTQRILEVKG